MLDEVENKMVEFGIDKAAYHGGDLIGRHVEKMLDKAEELFAAIRDILLEYEQERQDETRDVINRVTEICVLFSYLFSLCRTPLRTATNAVLDKVAVVVSSTFPSGRTDIQTTVLPSAGSRKPSSHTPATWGRVAATLSRFDPTRSSQI